MRTEAQMTGEALSKLIEERDPEEFTMRDAAPLRAIAAAERATRTAEEELHRTVAAARAEGVSWTAIAGVLGVSRQAVAQRFSA